MSKTSIASKKYPTFANAPKSELTHIINVTRIIKTNETNHAIFPHFLSSRQQTSGIILNNPLVNKNEVARQTPKYEIPIIIEMLHNNNPLIKNGSDDSIMRRITPQNAQRAAREKVLSTFLNIRHAIIISINPTKSLKISM